MEAVASTRPPKRLGEILIDRGLLSHDQLDIALKEQRNTEQPLGQTLVKMGFITETDLKSVLGEIFHHRSIDLSHTLPDEAALKLLGRKHATDFSIVPVSLDKHTSQLQIAIEDPNNLVVLDRLRAIVPRTITIVPLVAGKREILNTIDQFYGHSFSVDSILKEIETGNIDYSRLSEEDNEYDHPVVRLVNAILTDGVKSRASDIHFNPEEGFLRLRYRIDGVLKSIRSLHQQFWAAMSVRLKVMSGMNIAETRAPQDGRISMTITGRQIDFRVSSQPTTHGENIVLRILDRAKGIVPLDKLGLHPDNLSLLKLMLARPEGIILVTGPTGSGKTTTLYSMLSHINSPEVNIMTLEDPVEYPMAMIRQTSINEASRIDFANGIRSLMRQDPDIILVGEIRDAETAEMALRAAMTGHQVHSTLHTNSAIRAIPRLLDIGVEPGIMAGNIIGIVAQRLVRMLCTHCRRPKQANEIERKLLGADESEEIVLFEPVGCHHCDDTGYRGRLALMEVLKFNEPLDDMVAARCSVNEIHKHAVAHGFVPIAEDGFRRVREGITTLDEVSRVVDLTNQLG